MGSGFRQVCGGVYEGNLWKVWKEEASTEYCEKLWFCGKESCLNVLQLGSRTVFLQEIANNLQPLPTQCHAVSTCAKIDWTARRKKKDSSTSGHHWLLTTLPLDLGRLCGLEEASALGSCDAMNGLNLVDGQPTKTYGQIYLFLSRCAPSGRLWSPVPPGSRKWSFVQQESERFGGPCCEGTLSIEN